MLGQPLVLGLGEVGRPLLELLKQRFPGARGLDLEPAGVEGPVSVMHVCYPSQIPDFVGTTGHYFARFEPALTIIHSTVPPGTTRAVASRTGGPTAYSPIRGKHARMLQDLCRYTKFVGGVTHQAAELARAHLDEAGFRTAVLPAPEAAELAKLCETTYFGVLIAWAQEVERLAAAAGVRFEDATALFEDVPYLPRVKFFPGLIGGHCVMPNIAILRRAFAGAELPVTTAVLDSNSQKAFDQAAAEARAAGQVRRAA